MGRAAYRAWLGERMSTYRLDRLFSPRSIALVGASPRDKSIGREVLRNLRDGGFEGPISLVNPFHAEIDGQRTIGKLQDIKDPPDVVIVAVPPVAVLDTIVAASAVGAAVAIVLTAGLGHGPGSIADAVQTTARSKGLRVVGPNCLGVIAPAAKFNGSFAARMPAAGDLALISQSGAIAAGMVEWAAERGAGFSAVASVGDQIDVDVGDLLDHFALDRATRAILLYVEGVTDSRKFMSAARAAARVKPVVVVKGGRHAAGARAAATHTGALAGSDAVYDTAFRRAGLLRVDNLAELFAAAETLGRIRAMEGKRLAILTNGGGIGVLAVDHLANLGGTIAGLSTATRARLDKVLPPTWSQSNPVDIIGDADSDRYCAALEALLDDPENDAVLVMNVSTAVGVSPDVAAAVARSVTAYRERHPRAKPVMAVWLGTTARTAPTFHAAGIPSYATESDAISGLMHLVRYNEAARALMDTPPSWPEHFTPDPVSARRIVAGALADGRSWLDPIETANVLRAYRIDTIPTVVAENPDQAAAAAAALVAQGLAVVVKIHSRDIVHKSDVGGVRLNLTSTNAVRDAAANIIAQARAARPAAKILGVTVQPMIVRPQARELIAGIADDATFGPVIVFGHGGTGVEVIDDKALALPPLDLKMAHALIARTRVSRLLRGYRNVPAANEAEVAVTLIKLAQLAADVPEIRELDINPLLADPSGVTALDARIAIATVAARAWGRGHPRFAIRPYPIEWERAVTLADGMKIFVRPIRPEDEGLFPQFFEQTTQEDLRMRFFAPVKSVSHAFMARLTQLDYSRAMAFVALDERGKDLLGVVRFHADSIYETAEYAILLRSDLKGRGLGWRLMELIVEYSRNEGLKRIEGQVLAENTTMLRMCREQGFTVTDDPDEAHVKRVTLQLR
jgi:acetyltransferase